MVAMHRPRDPWRGKAALFLLPCSSLGECTPLGGPHHQASAGGLGGFTGDLGFALVTTFRRVTQQNHKDNERESEPEMQ